MSTREDKSGAQVGPDVAAIQVSEVCVPISTCCQSLWSAIASIHRNCDVASFPLARQSDTSAGGVGMEAACDCRCHSVAVAWRFALTANTGSHTAWHTRCCSHAGSAEAK